MLEWNPRANEIFLEARDRPAGLERARYVHTACGADSHLQAEVVALLTADDSAGCFLEFPLHESFARRSGLEFTERSGDTIGPYTLLEEIGQGGMGLVFRAEQSQPVQRQVALKIIKPGMDTRRVIARFEAERQAFAWMEHPNIAKVLDAGATDAGRPYFVMELVRGVPITQYCDDKSLTIRERITLFLPVCHAVQHAHQKGIIHRDLKPSNVLVAESEGGAVPKVIDFGVAKVIGPTLTERTLYTEFGLLIGTLEYMSPEQAQLGKLDSDTRSDIYSLGAMLYELLTGITPFDAERLRNAGFEEMLRILREEEPLRPSARCNRLPELAAIATARGLSPAVLSAELRGDLDSIIMKTLEKEPRQRYESAGDLARDLARYLNNEAVEASPPSQWYHLRKFVRRHRRHVIAGTLVLATLLIGIAVTSWEAVRATKAEQAALASAATAKLAAAAEHRATLNEAVQREIAQQRFKFLLFTTGVAQSSLTPEEMRNTLDEIAGPLDDTLGGDANLKAAFLLHIAKTCVKLQMYDEAVRELQQIIDTASEPTIVLPAKEMLGMGLLRLQRIDRATEVLFNLCADLLWRIKVPGADELRQAWPEVAKAEPRPSDRTGMDGLQFNGQTDYIVIPRLLFDGQPPWTIEAILKPTELEQFAIRGTSRWTSIISNMDGGGFGLETEKRKWSLSMYSVINPADPLNDYVNAVANDPVLLDRWQHIAGVWDGSELRLYVDGHLAATRKNITQCSTLTKWPFFVGADPCDPFFAVVAEGLFQGRMRAVRISRGAEYTSDFPSPLRLQTTAKTATLFDFTIDTGRYAIDRSGHGQNGIIVGAKFVPTENPPTR